MQRKLSSQKNTSWQGVNKWYDKLVGQGGQEYHTRVIFPMLLKMANLQPTDSVLDVGCGQGVLARQLPSGIEYLGIDASPSLIAAAKKRDHNSKHRYQVADATRVLNIKQKFSHIFFILSLQNMDQAEKAIENSTKFLNPNGKIYLVLNHPCFRIPRQSSWQIDESKKTQFRRIDRYREFLKIPITAHPGKSHSPVTWSYHYSLEQISTFLYQSGYMIEQLKELYSGKVSEGKAAKMENRARSEFPLFLLLSGQKMK